MWQNMGQDPKPAADAQAIVQTAKVPKGGKAVLLDLPGSGSLASLRLTMTPWNKELFDKAILRVTWDDQKVPAIEMPIGCLFGGGGDTIGAADVSGQDLPDAPVRLRRQGPAVPLLLAHAVLVAGEDRAA